MSDEEGREEESEEQADSQPQETFRQGYGSGRRRASGGGGGYGGRDRYRSGRTGGGYGRRQRGFDRPRERDHGPVPVEEGQELSLTIDALGRHGDGIARLNNFVIFVPGAKAGDQVKIRITTVRGSFATGEIVT